MPLYRNRYSGVCASGDIFVFTWWADSSADLATVSSAAVTWAEDAWNGIGTGTGLAPFMTAGVILNEVTTGLVDVATGRQSQLAEATVNLPGTAADPAMPADVAIVVSLRTNLANRSGRGRFYLPQPAAATLTADGRFAPSQQAAAVEAVRGAFAAFSATGTPVVYSRTMRATQPVVRLDIGDLFDTQRRRENALTEVRVSATV